MENKGQRNNLIDKVYDLGFEAGHEQGLDDAWEAVRKICAPTHNGGLSSDTLESIFGTCFVDEILNGNTASEAIAKIKAYEEQKKAEEEAVKVGDEVIHFDNGTKAVVLDVGDERIMVYDDNGIAEDWGIDRVRKTGRSFPQIAEVLKQLQEGEE